MRSATVTDVKNNFNKARLARLDSAGIIRRGREIPWKLINEAPPSGVQGASAVQAVLEERRSGR